MITRLFCQLFHRQYWRDQGVGYGGEVYRCEKCGLEHATVRAEY